MSNFPDPIQLNAGESATVSFHKAITDLNGPGKPMGKWKKPGWITRVLHGGVEKTLFLDENECESLRDLNVSPGSVLTINQTGPYSKSFEAEFNVGVDTPPATSVAPNPGPVKTPSPSPAAGNGWTTSSFDNKLTPDLSVTPFQEDTAPAQVFERAHGVVSTGFARRAKRLVYEMCGLSPDDKVTAAQMASLAPAIQDTYSTLLIQWAHLGYPVTEYDAPSMSGLADPDGDFD
jgi:hypothetical protein